MKKVLLIQCVLAVGCIQNMFAATETEAVQCANLIYAGTKTSKCFSDEFLSAIQKQTTIKTERRFRSVKLASDELFKYPFVIMTGESSFHLTSKERENLKKYVTTGGFLLASAGCSNEEWDKSFRREVKRLFNNKKLNKIDMDHSVYKTVFSIKKIDLKQTESDPRLEGLEHDGKIVAIYSHHGLNNTANAEGCCCCGGNEIQNSLEINVNIFVYALLH